jgi:hypothetical protein
MCYSKKVSKNSFIINVITCCILYNSKIRDNKILAIFFGFVGLMQLFDWIFWETQPFIKGLPKTGSVDIALQINFILTKIAMIVNHLQPIVFALAIYYFNGNIGEYSKVLLLVYSIVALMYSISVYNEIDYTKEKLEPNSGKSTLYWQWNSKNNNSLVYLLFVCILGLLAYENLSYPVNVIIVVLNFFTFFVAYNKNTNVGRYWCAWSSIIPLFLLIITPK